MAGGRPKGSPSVNKAAPPKGRPRGSLDRQQRQLVSNELSHSILTVFQAMGGVVDMLKWAEENKTIFYTQILSRLMPAPMKADGEDGPLVNINLGGGSDLESARRVAYLLAKGAAEAGDDPVKDRIPYSHLAEGPPVPTRPSWAPTEEDDDGQ